MKTTAGRYLFLIAFSLIIMISWTSTIAQETNKKSLYDRLGGVYAISTVVDGFIERLLVNDILNANPAIKEARDRVPKARLKYRLTELVCQVTGGQQKIKIID